jgi:prepilin-type N-terminal cleavage/methylation domain-containing protein
MKKIGSRNGGFTLVEIMIVVAIIGLLASVAIPNYMESRRKVQMNVCINNLRQIEGAIERWALETHKDEGQSVSYSDIRGYLKNAVTCPSGGTTFEDSYTITSAGTAPVCQRKPATHLLPP